MSTFGAPAVWFPSAVPSVRLTRRGRLARGVGVVLLLIAALLLAGARLNAEPVQADTGPTVPVVTMRVTVEQGDSLWAIARRIAPRTDPREAVVAIRELNGLASNLIQPGQVLLVPSSL